MALRPVGSTSGVELLSLVVPQFAGLGGHASWQLGHIYCSVIFRLQGQRQSPVRTTHLTHAGNTRTFGKDVNCLTVVGEP